MPGIPLLFTDTAGTPEVTYHPLPGLYLGDDTFLSNGIWLDEGISDAFAKAPALAQEGIVTSVTPVPAVAIQTTVTLPAGDVVIAVSPVPAVAIHTTVTLGGQDIVTSVTPVPAVAFMPVPSTTGGVPLVLIPSVRELPPLRLTHLIETPSGRFFRWAEDEPNPAYVPSGVRFSDTMPGGFETGDGTLPRKSGDATPDLEPFSTWRMHGAGGEKVWEGRLERAPRSSGDQVAVSPSAVGYQTALDDDKSATMIYVDIDLSRWGQMSNLRRKNLTDGGFWSVTDGSVTPADPLDPAGPGPGPELLNGFHGSWFDSRPLSESWYDSGPGTRIGVVYYAWRKSATIGLPDANWVWSVGLATDSQAVSVQGAGQLNSPGPGSGLLGANTTDRRFAFVQFYYGLTPAGGDVDYSINWTSLAVYGDHALPRYGVPDATHAPGLLASDIVKHAVGKWAPQLNVSATSVQPSSFVIPHLLFAEPTTASEIVKGASRFGLQDWAVWDDKTFYWHDRGSNARNWRTRVGPAQLEETGKAADRVWNSVLVQYQDVDGTTKTAGPPGSRTDSESASLVDTDPSNPTNQAGITRRALLTMGVATPASAIQIGGRFLQEQKLLDRSGRARIVGHVESDRGVLFPYHAVRAGDTLSVVDASDSSPRRIIRTEKDHSTRTCSVDLDAPPEGLQQLLERYGVGITDLGFS